MKIKFKYNFHDIREMVAVRPGQTMISKASAYIGGLALMAFPFLAYWVFNTPNKTYWEAYSQVFAISILGLGFLPPTNAAIQAWLMLKNQSKNLKNEVEFEFTDEGIRVENQDGNSFSKWSSFDYGKETNSLICLYRQKIGFAFPKRHFQEGQLDELRKCIKLFTLIKL